MSATCVTMNMRAWLYEVCCPSAPTAPVLLEHPLSITNLQRYSLPVLKCSADKFAFFAAKCPPVGTIPAVCMYVRAILLGPAQHSSSLCVQHGTGLSDEDLAYVSAFKLHDAALRLKWPCTRLIPCGMHLLAGASS